MLQSPHSLVESVHTVLEHDSTSLKERALLSELLQFCGDESNLLVGELGNDQRRKDDIRKWLDEMALNNLLGDSVDEVFQLILLNVSFLVGVH